MTAQERAVIAAARKYVRELYDLRDILADERPLMKAVRALDNYRRRAPTGAKESKT